MEEALDGVAEDPEPEGHARGLIAAKEEDSSSHNNKGEIPEHVEDHHGLRVGPIALALLELLRRGLPNHHRRLAHHAAAAGLAEEPRGLAEALALHESAAGVGVVWANVSVRIVAGVARGGVVVQKRRRVDDVGGGTARRPCRSHLLLLFFLNLGMFWKP